MNIIYERDYTLFFHFVYVTTVNPLYTNCEWWRGFRIHDFKKLYYYNKQVKQLFE